MIRELVRWWIYEDGTNSPDDALQHLRNILGDSLIETEALAAVRTWLCLISTGAIWSAPWLASKF